MKKIIIAAISILLLAGMLFIWMFYNGILLFNNPSRNKYPVRGVDVSAYQGEIDWDLLASQSIQFAYIKATEGSGFQDRNFDVNFTNAAQTDLRIGAYHFFSFDSSGLTQANNFIATVPKLEGMLPPVVDIEFYGDKEKNPPEREETQAILEPLLTQLEDHYGMKPVLYATKNSYDLYLRSDYEDYDIWIRDVFSFPKLSDGRSWTFWQYTNRETLKGYQGEEKYIDMNVFSGTEEEFQIYGK